MLLRHIITHLSAAWTLLEAMCLENCLHTAITSEASREYPSTGPMQRTVRGARGKTSMESEEYEETEAEEEDGRLPRLSLMLLLTSGMERNSEMVAKMMLIACT